VYPAGLSIARDAATGLERENGLTSRQT